MTPVEKAMQTLRTEALTQKNDLQTQINGVVAANKKIAARLDALVGVKEFEKSDDA